MTETPRVKRPQRGGRKKQWFEQTQARFSAGTLERISVLLGPKEYRMDFIREAVEREIKRRQRAIKPSD